jgi:hypothetical protein
MCVLYAGTFDSTYGPAPLWCVGLGGPVSPRVSVAHSDSLWPCTPCLPLARCVAVYRLAETVWAPQCADKGGMLRLLCPPRCPLVLDGLCCTHAFVS